MTLADFLLARISEDEAAAKAATVMRYKGDDYGAAILGRDRDATQAQDEHATRHDPARVLAECDAKRRIVAKAQRADVAMGTGIDPATAAAAFALTEVLHLLALPYRDHPDYREEWAL